ncbi:MAG: formylglycine-generating enzyme family protein [Gammaproteobacteria bacterium]|nr:formylglycine-generating enzyme family protein [Gammaproteobacteria bacterium]
MRKDASVRLVTEQTLQNLPDPGSPWPHNPPPQFPMPWARHWGQDAFGLWVAFTVNNVTQKMRWIPPGEFWMGSPEGEPEREGDEFRHRVLITRGYWLAETACNQALWQAVMGKNPSKFKGDDLPVENVSWDDVKLFCEKLDQEFPGLQARLPSEAQWEYACRAGTQTPFWWGNELTPELANYDGNSPYNNGEKGEYRKKTMPVKSFESNPWGLYQVHGNVWEWCEDWYESDYRAAEPSVDPTGADRGPYRVVVRGGGWIDSGRWLRAAYCYHYESGRRYDILGFRLAAGPPPGGAEEVEKTAAASVR